MGKRQWRQKDKKGRVTREVSERMDHQTQISI